MLRCRVSREFLLMFQANGMLFVETGSPERIDPERIGIEMPSDGGGSHLRGRNHYSAVRQTHSECFE
jgi:hypothetical protein